MFHTTESLAAQGYSRIVSIPEECENISIVVSVSGCQAKVQVCNESEIDILEEDDLKWIDWDAGLVSVTTSDVLYPVNALRLYQSGAGSSKMTVSVR